MLRVAFRVGDTRLFARLIHWWDACDVSHCEVAWDWHQNLHKCISSSLIDGGVRGKAIGLQPGKWRVYEVSGSPEDALQWLSEHEDERYDVLGLFGFVVRRVKGWLRAWFCSEACADMLKLREPWRWSPRMLEIYCASIGKRVL